MDDSDGGKKVSIPEWQKKGGASEVKPQSTSIKQSQESDEQTLETAKQFLAEDSIRDEPRERKITFLKKKGLQEEIIQKLLGADSETTVESPSSPEPQLKTVHDSTTAPVAPTAQIQSTVAPSQAVAAPTSNRDIPPIITYPEFLLRPQKPPPLVTVQRLVYAAYGFAGLSTLTYAASKYLIQPMLDSLTSARLELADTTLQDLEKLNAKLEANVSHVPYISPLKKRKENNGYIDEDAESIDSDPTELFHRDFATQTSPQHSRSSSTTSTNTAQPNSSHSKTTRQATSLTSLHDNLKSLVASTSSTTTTSESLKETVSDFQTYLNTLQFSGSAYRTDYSNIYASIDTKKVGKVSGETDEATKLKAEIRALKGVFLSSRNFPQGKPMVGSGSTGFKS